MSERFSRELVKLFIAEICLAFGFNKIQNSASEILIDIFKAFVQKIGYESANYAMLSNRSEGNFLDVYFSLDKYHEISISKLKQSLSCLEITPIPKLTSLTVPSKSDEKKNRNTNQINELKEEQDLSAINNSIYANVSMIVPSTPQNQNGEVITIAEISTCESRKVDLTNKKRSNTGSNAYNPNLSNTKLYNTFQTNVFEKEMESFSKEESVYTTGSTLHISSHLPPIPKTFVPVKIKTHEEVFENDGFEKNPNGSVYSEYERITYSNNIEFSSNTEKGNSYGISKDFEDEFENNIDFSDEDSDVEDTDPSQGTLQESSKPFQSPLVDMTNSSRSPSPIHSRSVPIVLTQNEKTESSLKNNTVSKKFNRNQEELLEKKKEDLIVTKEKKDHKTKSFNDIKMKKMSKAKRKLESEIVEKKVLETPINVNQREFPLEKENSDWIYSSIAEKRLNDLVTDKNIIEKVEDSFEQNSMSIKKKKKDETQEFISNKTEESTKLKDLMNECEKNEWTINHLGIKKTQEDSPVIKVEVQTVQIENSINNSKSELTELQKDTMDHTNNSTVELVNVTCPVSTRVLKKFRCKTNPKKKSVYKGRYQLKKKSVVPKPQSNSEKNATYDNLEFSSDSESDRIGLLQLVFETAIQKKESSLKLKKSLKIEEVFSTEEIKKRNDTEDTIEYESNEKCDSSFKNAERIECESCKKEVYRICEEIHTLSNDSLLWYCESCTTKKTQ